MAPAWITILYTVAMTKSVLENITATSELAQTTH
jgi:hypothetical protein